MPNPPTNAEARELQRSLDWIDKTTQRHDRRLAKSLDAVRNLRERAAHHAAEAERHAAAGRRFAAGQSRQRAKSMNEAADKKERAAQKRWLKNTNRLKRWRAAKAAKLAAVLAAIAALAVGAGAVANGGGNAARGNAPAGAVAEVDTADDAQDVVEDDRDAPSPTPTPTPIDDSPSSDTGGNTGQTAGTGTVSVPVPEEEPQSDAPESRPQGDSDDESSSDPEATEDEAAAGNATVLVHTYFVGGVSGAAPGPRGEITFTLQRLDADAEPYVGTTVASETAEVHHIPAGFYRISLDETGFDSLSCTDNYNETFRIEEGEQATATGYLYENGSVSYGKDSCFQIRVTPAK